MMSSCIRKKAVDIMRFSASRIGKIKWDCVERLANAKPSLRQERVEICAKSTKLV